MKISTLIISLNLSLLFIFSICLSAQNINGQPDVCEIAWVQGLLGECIGGPGLESVDIDNDGDIEMVIATSVCWYILEHEPSIGIYKITWRSADHYVSYAGITALKVADLEGDGSLEVLVTTVGGKVYIYDATTKSLKNQFTFSWSYYGGINELLVADVDNDGGKEIIISGQFDIYIHNIDGAFSQQAVIDESAMDIACGDVNNDGLNELILSTGQVCRLDGNSFVTLWEFNTSMQWGVQVVLHDVDNDGIEEIIYAGYGLYIFDADSQEEKWSIESNYSAFREIRLVDVDNNGTQEIVCGDMGEYDILCLNALTGEEIWRFENQEEDFETFTVGDYDGDGNPEGFWTSGCSSTGPDHASVYDLVDQTLEWRSIDGQGPFTVIKITDSDGDLKDEIITLTAESEWDGPGMITIFDAETRTIEWQGKPETGGNDNGMHDMEILDFDNDGVNEIIVAGGSTYNPYIWVFNGETYENESSHHWSSGGYSEISYFEVADVDNNGTLEYVMTSDYHIYVINPMTYNIEWISEEGYDKIMGDVIVENVDDDANAEIIIARDNLLVIDGITHIRWQTEITDFNIVCLYAYDYNNDGIKDVFAGTESGRIAVVDLVTRDIVWLNIDLNTPITGLTVANITGDEGAELIYTSEGITYFSNFNGSEKKSADLGNSPEKSSPIAVSDYDHDGVVEVFAGGEDCAVEFYSDCYACLDFRVDSMSVIGDLSTTPNCEGSVTLHLSGSAPFRYTLGGDTLELQNNKIEGLCSGLHIIKLISADGCELSTAASIEEVLLDGDEGLMANFTIYPVPATDILCVNIYDNITGKEYAQVSTLDGVIIKSVIINGSKSLIDIKALNPGMYLIRVISSKGETTKKFIKQ